MKCLTNPAETISKNYLPFFHFHELNKMGKIHEINCHLKTLEKVTQFYEALRMWCLKMNGIFLPTEMFNKLPTIKKPVLN